MTYISKLMPAKTIIKCDAVAPEVIDNTITYLQF